MSLRRAWRAQVLLAAVAVAGCYESRIPLSAPATPLDPRLLGSWLCVPEPDPKEFAIMRVKAFDEFQYVAEWRDEDRVTAYRAFGTMLGSTAMLNVQELKDRDNDRRWFFLRYTLMGSDRLSLALVQESAVKGANERARIDAVIAGAAGSAIYDEPLTCTRLPASRN